MRPGLLTEGAQGGGFDSPSRDEEGMEGWGETTSGDEKGGGGIQNL